MHSDFCSTNNIKNLLLFHQLSVKSVIFLKNISLRIPVHRLLPDHLNLVAYVINQNQTTFCFMDFVDSVIQHPWIRYLYFQCLRALKYAYARLGISIVSAEVERGKS